MKMVGDKDKIKEIIKTKVRPILVMDGGNIEFVDYKNKIVTVKLLGACRGCPLSAITLKNTVEGLIKEEVPSVAGVEAVDFDEEL
ncbi:MAG: NifU family protein [Rickettsiales bacterium]|nr:NifU family protein [Rickettsiales bacterium]